MSLGNIIEKYYYIIKVVCDNGNKIYYKIGEANKRNRPEFLIEKYRKLRSNDAELLLFEALPHNSDKRLNDKEIHKQIDSTLLKKADPIYIKHYLDETDGKEEFFELVSNVDVVDYIQKLVKSIPTKCYNANNIYDTKLEYKADQYHLVNADIIAKIIDRYNSINKELYHYTNNNNILLVGQFEPEFIASIAMFHNITLWHDSAEQKHEYKFGRINNNITYIDTLGELLMSEKDFDIIISNPPYGKVGAEITHNIIDNINYKEFVNLLPANDYHKAKDDDLYKYANIESMTYINKGFADAAVTTHMAKINKKPSKITEAEFEIKNYIDRSLDKYFFENYRRNHYAIDKIISNLNDSTKIMPDNKVTVLIGWRDLPNHHMPYSKNCTTYKWNIEKSIDAEYLYNNVGRNSAKVLSLSTFTFKTEPEKDNFTKFMYSITGFKFIAKLFTAVNIDVINNSAITKILPKVDWTREWTVEEILADYGYTESEIKEVMDDLVNFKDMDRD